MRQVLRRTEQLLEERGRDYDYLISRPVGAKVKERYAFLFDRGMVRVIEDGAVYSLIQTMPFFASRISLRSELASLTSR